MGRRKSAAGIKADGLTFAGLATLIVLVVYLLSRTTWVAGEVPRTSVQCSTHCGPVPPSVAFIAGLGVVPLLIADFVLSIVVLVVRRRWDRVVGICGVVAAVTPVGYFVVVNLVA